MRKAKFFLVAIILLHVILLLNLKFTAWPEMLFWPYLMLKGWLPYRDMAIAHTPALLVDLTIFYKIFGLGLLQLKIYTWILIISTDLLLFWIAKRLWNIKIAVMTLLFYIPLTIFYEGNGLWFDLALAQLALIVFYCLEKKNYLWAGIFWTVAFLTKQTAFWLLFPIIFTGLRQPFKEFSLRVIDPPGSVTFKILRKFVLGASAIGIAFYLVLQNLGIWGDFRLWALKFGITTLPASSGQIHFPTFRQFVIAGFPFLLMILSSLMHKKNYKLLVWTVFAALGVFPRWELFHFQPALPFLALSFALIFIELSKLKPMEKLIFKIGLLIMLVVILVQVLRDFRAGTRFFEPSVIKLANYVKERTEKNDEIYLVNAWDNLYVLTETIPATRPWLPQLSWYLEIPGIQDLVISDLMRSPPKLIIQAEFQETGLGAYKPEKINNFIVENYNLSDKIDGYLIFLPK